MKDNSTFADKVLASDYSALFQEVCTDPAAYYECIGRAIAAYDVFRSQPAHFQVRLLAEGAG